MPKPALSRNRLESRLPNNIPRRPGTRTVATRIIRKSLAGSNSRACHRRVASSPTPRARYPSAKFILRGQAIGFSSLLILMWSAELLHLPHYFFGDSPDSMWSRLTIRTFVLLGIWLIVHLTTSHLLKRLHELERYLRICGWCRKVDDHGEWRTMEDYFGSRFHTDTTHGICPLCARNQLSQHLDATRETANAEPSPAARLPH